MKKILALALALCLMCTLCATAFAADKTYELKLSTTQTDTSMIYAGMKAAADKILEDTDGHVKVTIYPSSQLGAEEDMIDQALQGMNIAVLTDAGRLSSYARMVMTGRRALRSACLPMTSLSGSPFARAVAM